jgi:hypothetical protein
MIGNAVFLLNSAVFFIDISHYNCKIFGRKAIAGSCSGSTSSASGMGHDLLAWKLATFIVVLLSKICF